MIFQNKSGWQVNGTYREYVKFLTPEILKNGTPALLLKDNHSTHNAEEVENDLDENGILNVSLVPHTTHFNQANDWTLHVQAKRLYKLYRDDYMLPLINAWIKDIVKNRRSGIKEAPARPELTIVDSLKIYKQVDDELRQHPEWVAAGWRATGWYPFAPEKLHKEMTLDVEEVIDEVFDIESLIESKIFTHN